MKICKTAQLTLAAGLLSLLTACGGDSSTSTSTGTAPTTEQVAAFTSSYNSGLAGLKSFSGLTSTSFVDLFDDAFLDAGYTKQALKDSLAQDSIAASISADLDLAPTAALSGVTVTNCDTNGICTLTATVTNSDVDTTTLTYSTQVKFSNSKVRLFGDQKAS